MEYIKFGKFAVKHNHLRNLLLLCMFAFLIFGLLSFSACNSDTDLPEETESEIETAYLNYLRLTDESIFETQFVKYAGTYSGNIVAMMSCYSNEWAVAEVVVEYYVDNFFVCNLPNGRYSVIVYMQSKEIKDLRTAYNDGDITKTDLMSIGNALK